MQKSPEMSPAWGLGMQQEKERGSEPSGWVGSSNKVPARWECLSLSVGVTSLSGSACHALLSGGASHKWERGRD